MWASFQLKRNAWILVTVGVVFLFSVYFIGRPGGHAHTESDHPDLCYTPKLPSGGTETSFDAVIVGAGLSGAVVARQLAEKKGLRVLVLDRRSHIGGNCYDTCDAAEVLVQVYGAHLFHTNVERVYEFLSRFTEWIPYKHRVKAMVDGIMVPVPVNRNTINLLFETDLRTDYDVQQWFFENTVDLKGAEPKNSEELALSTIGPALYEKIFKHYTIKQWDVEPSKLNSLVIRRIPVRTSVDDGYFGDKHQIMPKYGYTSMIEKILTHDNIVVRLNTDFFDVKDKLKFTYLLYTGPVDRYFNYEFGHLQYRSLSFKSQSLQMKQFQPIAVVNYPNEHNYTRILEMKHATGQHSDWTTIVREYPTWHGEPYYPVPTAENYEKLRLYQKHVRELPETIVFAGRLADYRYYNMDATVDRALDAAEEILGNRERSFVEIPNM